MNQRSRLQAIIRQLQQKPELTVDEACVLVDASPATIRRDFNLLSENGEVVKTWGGIAKTDDHSGDMKPLRLRQSQNIREKRAIARKAASMIQEGDVILIDGGTTTLEMAPLIANLKIRIITNSILIAHEIQQLRSGWKGAEIFLIGGFLYPDSGLIVGPEANKNLMQYHADYAFLSVGGIEKEIITNSNQLVVETEKTMMQQSDQVIILADKSKIGSRTMVKLCDPKEVNILITNKQADQKILTWLEVKGIKVLQV